MEHVRSESGLLEMAVGGERLRQSPLLHDDEREAIRQAPILIRPAPVQFDRGIAEIGLKRHDLYLGVGSNSAISLGRDPANTLVRKCVQPFPEHRLSRYDPACGLNHRLPPGGSVGMTLIPPAGNGYPERTIGEVDIRHRHWSAAERP